MKRQANIELLRIVAMLMIIGSHLALHGVQSDWNVWSAGNRPANKSQVPKQENSLTDRCP